jgi:hypothetical protein
LPPRRIEVPGNFIEDRNADGRVDRRGIERGVEDLPRQLQASAAGSDVAQAAFK